MSTAADFRLFYPSKENSADDQVLDVKTALGTSSIGTVIFTTSDATGFWDGAIIFFDEATTTVALQGVYAHVLTSALVTTTNELTLAKALPDTPVGTDTFKLVLGGNYRSSEEVPGLTSAGLSNLAAFMDITYTGYENGEGVGTLTWTTSSDLLQWTAPSGVIGTGTVITSDGTVILFDDNDSQWIEIDITDSASLLAAGDTSDAITLTQPSGIFIPDMEGVETLSGKVRYHLLPVKNIHASDSIFDVRVFVEKSNPNAVDTTLATGTTTGSSVENVTGTDFTDWPTSGWIFNSDVNGGAGDLRYFYNRSGNTIRVQQRTGTLRGFTAVNWTAAENVELFPEFDIGLEAPTALQFTSPVDETDSGNALSGAGITFSAPLDITNALTIGTLANGDIYGVWIREEVIIATRARPNVTSVVKFKLDVSGL